MKTELPVVYSCSGCSSAAQLANALAIRLDHAREAEMSCIVGVGGAVPALLRTARSGRPILALDGCEMRCVAACLSRAELVASRHVVLTEHGVKKRKHVLAEAEQENTLYHELVLPAARGLQREMGSLVPVWDDAR